MKLNLVLSVFFSFALIPQAFPMALNFDKRRFAQEHTAKAEATYTAVRNISLGTGKEQQAGDLSGAMVRALLAKAPTCDQQDRADEIIDLAIEIGGDKKEKLIKVAKTYRQLERNTPKAGQPSELCKKKPRHKELDGLVQAQDPTGKGKDPDPTHPKPKDPKKPKDPEKPKDPKKHEKPKADPVQTVDDDDDCDDDDDDDDDCDCEEEDDDY
ncbi:unnamed protein product [Rhizophagus irregularis]|nr:unnamed protein product [Rhizophagus irregularis]CAB5372275.1 unnamed protein product [Rhizophagus irregularis]